MARERLSWKFTVGAGVLVALFVGALLLVGFDFVWTEYRWFSSVGRQGVLVTRVLSQLGVWLVCTAIATAVSTRLHATADASRAGPSASTDSHLPDRSS